MDKYGEAFPNPMPRPTDEQLVQEMRYIYSMATRRWTYDRDLEERVIRGSIDAHLHAGPDVQTRVWDEVELTVLAARAGMGALVFKNHVTMTSGRVSIVTQAARAILENEGGAARLPTLIGGVVLNRAVGGINPEAVQASIDLGGKFVWLPTFDSDHHHQMMGRSDPGIHVAVNGRLIPEMKRVLELAARHRQVLSLCHLSVKDRFLVIEEARAAGVEKILVDHPLLPITKTSIEEQRRMADMGAKLGFYFQCCIPNIMNLFVNFEQETLRMVSDIGPEHLVAGTDLGQPQNVHPIDGMRLLFRSLAQYGVEEKALVQIFQRNGEALLDLPPAS